MFEGQVVDELSEEPVTAAKERKLTLRALGLGLGPFVNSAIFLVSNFRTEARRGSLRANRRGATRGRAEPASADPRTQDAGQRLPLASCPHTPRREPVCSGGVPKTTLRFDVLSHLACAMAAPGNYSRDGSVDAEPLPHGRLKFRF